MSFVFLVVEMETHQQLTKLKPPSDPQRTKLPAISFASSELFPSDEIYQISQCLDLSYEEIGAEGNVAIPPSTVHSSFVTVLGNEQNQHYLDNISELNNPESKPKPLADVLELPIPLHLRDQLCFEEILLVSVLNNAGATEDVGVGRTQSSVQGCVVCFIKVCRHS